MFRRKKEPKVVDPNRSHATDGKNTFITFETTTHAEAGCPRGCEGDHVRVAVHGCRTNLDNLPYEEWTTPEILATEAAEYIAAKLTLTKIEAKGQLQ